MTDSLVTNTTALRQGKAAFLLFVALTAYFWWPCLWQGQVMLHADAAHHGLSLLAFLADGLHGQRELLWDSGIYGGHPLFAESQGGFLNPTNVLCALLFSPEYGIGVLFWLNMLIGGGGVYALCRVLGLSHWASCFACIGVAYSGIWLHFQYNISVTATMSWLPWLFAAVEYWLNRPILKRAALMALPATLMVFSGYPHIVYGAAIYLAAYCLVLPLKATGRTLIFNHSRQLVVGGSLALLLSLGLSAIQLLPLLELASQSHRNSGIDLLFGGLVPTVSYLRGLLFFDWWLPAPITTFGSVASMSVCLLAVLGLLCRPPVRILAHGFAAFVTFNLGMEYASPLFRVLYEYDLLPGLHSFRGMHPFFVPATIGFAVLAAHGLDKLCSRKHTVLPIIVVIPLFFALCYAIYDPQLRLSNFIAPVFIALMITLLIVVKQQHWLALIAVMAISIDALWMRSDIYNFFDISSLAKPRIIKNLLQEQNLSSYRAADLADPLAGTFKLSNDPAQKRYYRELLDSINPFPSLRWGIPSINGVLALQLSRRGLVGDDILREVEGISPTPPGGRLIDILGVKYISHKQQLQTVGFQQIDQSDDGGIRIYRNQYALPQIRTYREAVPVKSAKDALQKVRAGNAQNTLLVEGVVPKAIDCQNTATETYLSKATGTRYKLRVISSCPVWLYINDASYPGWSARINKNSAPVMPAQILGKAVYLPAGDNRVEVYFTPWSFYIGCIFSAGALLTLLFILRRRINE